MSRQDLERSRRSQGGVWSAPRGVGELGGGRVCLWGFQGGLGIPGGSRGGGTLSFPSRVRERLKPQLLVSALMALMAPDFTSSFACSVAVAVSRGGWSDSAGGGGRRGGGGSGGCHPSPAPAAGKPLARAGGTPRAPPPHTSADPAPPPPKGTLLAPVPPRCPPAGSLPPPRGSLPPLGVSPPQGSLPPPVSPQGSLAHPGVTLPPGSCSPRGSLPPPPPRVSVSPPGPDPPPGSLPPWHAPPRAHSA